MVWADSDFLDILNANEKLQVSKFRYFGKFIIQLSGSFLRSCFWSTTDWFKDITQIYKPWNYGARDARAFSVFCSF